MAILELPHTAGCLVCGRMNPSGLHLSLFVDEQSGAVSTTFTPRPEHIGFEGIVHGGILATVLDEAMVWAATWAQKRFCLCGEMTVRFRQSAAAGRPLRVEARVESQRARLIQTTAEIYGENSLLLATGSGKYVPLPPEQNRAFVQTFAPEAGSEMTARSLQEAAGLSAA